MRTREDIDRKWKFKKCEFCDKFKLWFYVHSEDLCWSALERMVSLYFSSVQFSSVAQSCPTLCDPVNCSMAGLLSINKSQSSLRLTSTESVMPSSHLILCRPLLLLPPIPTSIRAFPVSQLFTWGDQITGVSALASVLPKNTQDWSPLEWTSWISLQSKGPTRVFSNTTVQSISSSVFSFLYGPVFTFIHDHWKNHSLN